MDVNALHTYRANLEDDQTNLYLGSVNNFLFDVITGRACQLPRPGDIELILAGSPCQGFSNANPTGRDTVKSLANAGLVCATLTAIEVYRPKYAILENVTAMAQTHESGRVGQPFNVANQIMCALIGMGYQCRAFILDAWHFGAPQDRIRLFIEIAAPGCTLPGIPPGSHAHPLYAKGRSVGKTSANVKFASRDLDLLTSFPPVELRDSWDDLPSLGNGHLGVCIPYPDHKVPWTMNARDRGIAALIPASDSVFRHPDYKYALRLGLVPQHLKLPTSRNENSRRFQRLAADRNVPTVTCSMNPISEICGRTLHYRENRPFSILEAKRLQGFLDTDVLVGKPRMAIKIIGNSVCRQVAFALGEKLAEAVGSGHMESGAEVPVNDGLKTEEKLDFTNMKREISTPRSRRFMVMIEQKSSRQGIVANTKVQKVSTDKDKVSDDTTVNLTGAEKNDKLGISVISSPRKKSLRIQLDNTRDQDM